MYIYDQYDVRLAGAAYTDDYSNHAAHVTNGNKDPAAVRLVVGAQQQQEEEEVGGEEGTAQQQQHQHQALKELTAVGVRGAHCPEPDSHAERYASYPACSVGTVQRHQRVALASCHLFGMSCASQVLPKLQAWLAPVFAPHLIVPPRPVRARNSDSSSGEEDEVE